MNDRTHPNDEATVERVLEEGRRQPSAATRSRIRSTIAAAGPLRSRPAQLRGLIAAYATAGAALLALAGLGLAGVGPLGS
jgi:hypothetical protein